jgi:hypothetical protein
VCRCVSSMDLFLLAPSWFCINVAFVLLASRHVTAFSPCLSPLYLREVLGFAWNGDAKI